ncbi:hypothetical protein COP1_019105 [Malus domestica]
MLVRSAHPTHFQWPPPQKPTTGTRSALRSPPDPDLLSGAGLPRTARSTSLTVTPAKRETRAKSPDSQPEFRERKTSPSDLERRSDSRTRSSMEHHSSFRGTF